jgi:hypothetical protein
MLLDRRPDGSVRIWLGAEEPSNDLAGLTEGERVCVVYPGELMAEGMAQSEYANGWTTWYAVMPSMDAIVSLYDERQPDRAPASATQE